uniref:Nitrogen permease regulator 2 n=1 Tax=Ascaris lumbricoides TaxID=6252 RepID=A0A0M3IEX8_ASCLU
MPFALNSFFPSPSDVPKLKAIIFAEFDADKGPVIRFQVPEVVFDAKKFDTFSSAIIPKSELFQRLIKVNHIENTDGKIYKVMGHPVGIESEAYPRGRYIFNLCFVVDKSSKVDCMYEPMVQKCAAYLTQLETENQFLSQCKHKMPQLMQSIFDGLNTQGECKIPVSDGATFYLKLCPSFHGIEPPKVSPYMVPMFTRVPPPKTPYHLPKMDVLSQKASPLCRLFRFVRFRYFSISCSFPKDQRLQIRQLRGFRSAICPKIDGVRCIKDIALLVQIDADLVARCVRNLHFYGCLTLLPLFMYSNTYVANEQLHHFYLNADTIEACLDFVGPRNKEGEPVTPKPIFSDVFRLYVSLRTGITMKEWCERLSPRQYNVDERRLIQFGVFHGFIRKLSIYPTGITMKEWCERLSPRQYNVDERRLIQFGVFHGFIRKLSIYPVALKQGDNRRIAKLCDGSRSLEDLAVIYTVSPLKLHTLLQNDTNFVFISK